MLAICYMPACLPARLRVCVCICVSVWVCTRICVSVKIIEAGPGTQFFLLFYFFVERKIGTANEPKNKFGTFIMFKTHLNGNNDGRIIIIMVTVITIMKLSGAWWLRWQDKQLPSLHYRRPLRFVYRKCISFLGLNICKKKKKKKKNHITTFSYKGLLVMSCDLI